MKARFKKIKECIKRSRIMNQGLKERCKIKEESFNAFIFKVENNNFQFPTSQ